MGRFLAAHEAGAGLDTGINFFFVRQGLGAEFEVLAHDEVAAAGMKNLSVTPFTRRRQLPGREAQGESIAEHKGKRLVIHIVTAAAKHGFTGDTRHPQTGQRLVEGELMTRGRSAPRGRLRTDRFGLSCRHGLCV